VIPAPGTERTKLVATSAGLLVGDLISALDNVPLTSPDDLLDLLTGERVGRNVALRVIRGGSAIDVEVGIIERQ